MLSCSFSEQLKSQQVRPHLHCRSLTTLHSKSPLLSGLQDTGQGKGCTSSSASIQTALPPARERYNSEEQTKKGVNESAFDPIFRP